MAWTVTTSRNSDSIVKIAGVPHVLEHLPVAAQASNRTHDEVVRDHVDTQQEEERDAADGGRHPGAAGSGSQGASV